MGEDVSTASAPTTAQPRRPSVHLMARHREILRLTLLGWSATRIAVAVGVSAGAVYAVMRSPLMRAELERMQDEADRLTIDTPLRARMEAELRGATIEAVRLNRRLMNDTAVDAKLRSGVAKHFMDRVLFDVDESGERQSGYREILRRLDDVDKQLGRGVWLIAEGAEKVDNVGSASNGSPPPRDESHDPLSDAVARGMNGVTVPAD